MLKIADNPYRHALDYSLHGKSRSEVYGFIAGIFKRIGICQTLGTTTSDFLDLLIDVEKEYNDNPYHSFYHAVDVAMVLYHMLGEYGMSEYLNRFDLAMLMLAALFHDIGHPGNNNSFEVSCKTERALQYNNLSVLESHSSTIALQLLEKHNYLRNVESKSREFGCPISLQEFQSSIVQMILATDMVCHFTLKDNIAILHDRIRGSSHLQHLKSALKPPFSEHDDPFKYFKQKHFNQAMLTTTCAVPDAAVLHKKERLMMCNILLHAADVSNPCRPWPVFYQQSRLVCVEFFRQGEKELSLGLPVSPNMDQKIANPSKINVGFIDFIVNPYFEALSELFPKCVELVHACTRNRQKWLDLATETIGDVHGIPSVETTLGTFPMTIAAGTVQIPDSVVQERNRLLLALKRSASSNNVPQFLAAPLMPAKRRKSEEVGSVGMLRQIHHTRSSSITKNRRKSEELSTYMLNQPKIVSFFD
ncbi:hypothetical protein [Parasitella parasitica]|uniref:Phosphodiesterase n=1 Tax=Parasitella parasitica TaxID=35722 RepID=A0A0B7NJQ0_9FUNG|nr:hypothetical protein [Parasitella parasitica]